MNALLPLLLIQGQFGQSSHIAVESYVNQKKALFIIDTGASNTVLDLTRSARFELRHDLSNIPEMAVGLGSDQIESSIARAELFSLGEMNFPNFPFVLLDLSIINTTFARFGQEPVDGIIGNDLLISCSARISYPDMLIRLRGNKRKIRQWFREPFSL